MSLRYFGCPPAPPVGAISALLIAILAFFSGKKSSAPIYPTWTDLADSWMFGLDFVLVLVAAVSAYTFSQLFHEDSVLSLGLGGRSQGSILVGIASSWITLATVAYLVGMMPATLNAFLHGAAPGGRGIILVPCLVLTALVAIACAASIGAMLGLATKNRPSIFSAVLAAVPFLILCFASKIIGSYTWLLTPGSDYNYFMRYHTPVRYFALICALLIFILVALFLSVRLAARPVEVSQNILITCGLIAAAVVLLSIATHGAPRLTTAQYKESCQQVAAKNGTQLKICLNEENEPRRNALETQFTALIDRYGADFPIQEVWDQNTSYTDPGRGVFTVHIDKSGNNAEYRIAADALSGTFACAKDTTPEHFNRASTLAHWLAAVPLPQEMRHTQMIVSDDEPAGDRLLGDEQAPQEFTASLIPGETPESVQRMQQYIAENAAAIAECQAPPFPEGVAL